MGRYLGPKNKLARREGVDLELKSPGTSAHAQLLRRLNIPPGVHGPKGRKKLSEYGKQLREKQKLKRLYGILERQLKNYYKRAIKIKGDTGLILLRFLEKRLDNVVYRLGFAPTRAAARQLVSHGHIRVDGKKVDIPSYQVRPGEVISIREKSLNIPIIKKMLAEKNVSIPGWLERKAHAGKVLREPEREEIGDLIDESLIVEFYSR